MGYSSGGRSGGSGRSGRSGYSSSSGGARYTSGGPSGGGSGRGYSASTGRSISFSGGRGGNFGYGKGGQGVSYFNSSGQRVQGPSGATARSNKNANKPVFSNNRQIGSTVAAPKLHPSVQAAQQRLAAQGITTFNQTGSVTNQTGFNPTLRPTVDPVRTFIQQVRTPSKTVQSATPFSNQSRFELSGTKAVPTGSKSTGVFVPTNQSENFLRKDAQTGGVFTQQQDFTTSLAQEVQRRREALLKQGLSYAEAQRIATSSGVTRQELNIVNTAIQREQIQSNQRKLITAEKLIKGATTGSLPADSIKNLSRDISNTEIQKSVGADSGLSRVQVQIDADGNDVNARRTRLQAENALLSGIKPEELNFEIVSLDKTQLPSGQVDPKSITFRNPETGEIDLDLNKFTNLVGQKTLSYGGQSKTDILNAVIKQSTTRTEAITPSAEAIRAGLDATTSQIQQQSYGRTGALALDEIFAIPTSPDTKISAFVDVTKGFNIDKVPNTVDGSPLFSIKDATGNVVKQTASEAELLSYLLQEGYIKIGRFSGSKGDYSGSTEVNLNNVIASLRAKDIGAVARFADVIAMFENIRPQFFIKSGPQYNPRQDETFIVPEAKYAENLFDPIRNLLRNFGVNV